MNKVKDEKMVFSKSMVGRMANRTDVTFDDGGCGQHGFAGLLKTFRIGISLLSANLRSLSTKNSNSNRKQHH